MNPKKKKTSRRKSLIIDSDNVQTLRFRSVPNHNETVLLANCNGYVNSSQ